MNWVPSALRSAAALVPELSGTFASRVSAHIPLSVAVCAALDLRAPLPYSPENRVESTRV